MTLSTFLAQYPPQHKAGCEQINPNTVVESWEGKPYLWRSRTSSDPPAQCSCGLDDALADLRLRAQQQEQEEKEQETRVDHTQYAKPLATASENQPVPTSASDSLDWRTCGIVELAVRNPNVASYTKHWEGRAVAAERTLDSLAVMLGWGNTPPQHIFESEIRAMKARIRESTPRDSNSSSSEAQLHISAQRLQEVIAKWRERAEAEGDYAQAECADELAALVIGGEGGAK